MIGYPITYDNTLEEGKGFTSETLFAGISEYCSSEKTQENFCEGYKFGLLFFSIASLLVSSTPAFANEKGSITPPLVVVIVVLLLIVDHRFSLG